MVSFVAVVYNFIYLLAYCGFSWLVSLTYLHAKVFDPTRLPLVKAIVRMVDGIAQNHKMC